MLEFNDEADIGILEQSIYDLVPKILALLLQDKTTRKNIFWVCNSYVEEHGKKYHAESQTLPHQITGAYTKLIRPRTEKSKDEQKNRMRKKAKVFTPYLR